MAAITLRQVYKTFRIPHERHTTLTERLLHMFHQIEYENFEALRGVDVTIEKGSFVGIIGRNGSGKSTLLKLIAGLLPPDQGEIHVDGTMSALLELGLGFSPELTVQENVELYAAVLGYPRREIKERIVAAITFAELERFRDAKLKNLSTGMRARLGFATALQAECDILLLDEILAVGDESFQRKCIDVFLDLKRRRRTIILVSHDLHQIQALCDQAIYIEAGRVAAAGPPELVITQYLESLREPVPEAVAEGAADADTAATANGAAERVTFHGGWLADDQGQPAVIVTPGARVVLVCRAQVMTSLENPIFGMLVNERDGPIIYVTSTFWLGVHTGMLEAGQMVELRLPFDAPMHPGAYIISIMATNATRTEAYGTAGNLADFSVDGAMAHRNAVVLQGGFSCRVVTDEEAGGRSRAMHAEAERGGIS
jgi:ABC-type polysaccharide/polyol phosphate transport system ATPase subunit